MSWIEDVFDPAARSWEEMYRNRWAHDKVVRSTHGVNCTGGCSWNLYVKQGFVTWELQALDYPRLDPELPSYEPRGCQRGISTSWYLYSPLRVKHPTVRGVLLDLWHEARQRHPDDPLAAWQSIVSDPERRRRYHRGARQGRLPPRHLGRGPRDPRRRQPVTVRTHGPDRIVGFSPIPAMSMVSYAGGSRLMQLMGGVSLSFYDWYCDLPPASPEIWGEQTDVGESADWYHAEMIAVVGSNVLGTRTPDAHFLVEARHKGTKVVVFSPDFSQTSKAADEWIRSTRVRTAPSGWRSATSFSRSPTPTGRCRRSAVPGPLHRRPVPGRARGRCRGRLHAPARCPRFPPRGHPGRRERRLEAVRHRRRHR